MSFPLQETLSVRTRSVSPPTSPAESFQGTFVSSPIFRETSPDTFAREQANPSYKGCTLRQIMERLPVVVMPNHWSSSGLSSSHQKLEKFYWVLGQSMRQLAMFQTEWHVSRETQDKVLSVQLISCELESIMKALQKATENLCPCSQLSRWEIELRFGEDELVDRGQTTEFVAALFGQPSRDSAISRLLGLDHSTVQAQPQSNSSFPILKPTPSPPTCSIIQAFYRSTEQFPLRFAVVKETISARGDMGPASDVANLFLLRNCGPAAVLFRSSDFPLWTATRYSGRSTGTRECMQRVYGRSIPSFSEFKAKRPSSDDICYASYVSYRNVFPNVAQEDPIRPVLYLRQMELIMAFVEAAIGFQKSTVALGRRVLEEYAAAELRIANAKADTESHSSRGNQKEAYDTDIGMLLQELFIVNMPMLRKLSENNYSPDVREVLKLGNVADWPGPAIKRRKIPMRLAGILECGPDYDI